MKIVEGVKEYTGPDTAKKERIWSAQKELNIYLINGRIDGDSEKWLTHLDRNGKTESKSSYNTVTNQGNIEA